MGKRDCAEKLNRTVVYSEEEEEEFVCLLTGNREAPCSLDNAQSPCQSGGQENKSVL